MKLVDFAKVIVSILLIYFPLPQALAFYVAATTANYNMSPPRNHSSTQQSAERLSSSATDSSKTSATATIAEEEMFNIVRLSADAVSSASTMIVQVQDQQQSCFMPSTTKTKILYCIRHGSSVTNEWMQLPENSWGAPTFCDDWKMKDSRLSETGIRQAQDMCKTLLQHPIILDSIELVLVSPLTRCLQTYRYGVAPALLAHSAMIPVVAVPLMTERVYTVGETGRPISELEREFPEIDWSHAKQSTIDKQPWWYDPTVATEFHPDPSIEYPEWRPHCDGQQYQVAGEPMTVFSKRMHKLQEYIQNRPEQHILCIAHWGVFRFLSDGIEMENCQITRIELQSSSPSSSSSG